MDPDSSLPDLRTRETVRGFLHELAAQLGGSLADERTAQELDRRDQLAGMRDKFHVPLISELLEEEERAPGSQGGRAARGLRPGENLWASLLALQQFMVFLLLSLRKGLDVSQQSLYMLANSLGLQPKALRGMINTELDKWAHKGHGGRFAGDYPW